MKKYLLLTMAVLLGMVIPARAETYTPMLQDSNQWNVLYSSPTFLPFENRNKYTGIFKVGEKIVLDNKEYKKLYASYKIQQKGDAFIIDSDKLNMYNIKILNMYGDIFFQKLNNIGETTIITSYFQKGVYLIQIDSKENSFIKKVIIQ